MLNIEIQYCVEWNYKPRAVSLADELQDAFGVEATLVPGSGGAFEISVDGKLEFSKFQTGRFPEPGEIVQKLKNK